MTRLKEKYQKDVVPALQKEFGYKNVMAVPKVQKVVVNMGLGDATSNAKIVDVGADELARITGQKPVTRASSSAPTSTSFALLVASPRPILMTTFSIFGTAITFL